LAPDVVLLRPDEVASGVDGIDSGGLKDLTGEAMFLRKVLVDFEKKFVGVVRRGDIALGEVAGCVRKRNERQAAVGIDEVLHSLVQHAARNHIA
jgi:hypothetical protein